MSNNYWMHCILDIVYKIRIWAISKPTKVSQLEKLNIIIMIMIV